MLTNWIVITGAPCSGKTAVIDELSRRGIRVVPDSIAYYLLEGLNPAEPRRESRRVRYRQVFLFERLEFASDPVRSEDAETAGKIERLITAAYAGLGYALVRVPVMPVARRADFVMSEASRPPAG